MARVIAEPPAWVSRRGPGRREIYPYDDWFDGQVYELTSPDDFTVNIRTMRLYIKRAAERRGLKVVVEHDGEVIVVYKGDESSASDDGHMLPRRLVTEPAGPETDYRGLSEDEVQVMLDQGHAKADMEDHRRTFIDLDECDPILVVKRL